MKKLALALVLLTSAMAAPTYAATIVPVAAVVPAMAPGTPGYPGYGPGFAIDTAPNTDWASFSGGAGSYINFDLGSGFILNSASVTDRVTSGGPNSVFYGGLFDYTTAFTLTFSNDPNFGTNLGSVSFLRPIPSTTGSPSDFNFNAALGSTPKVRYVRYTVDVANGANPGLSDISFTGSVPEPTTWAMMLMGFGMIGAGVRSRSKPTVKLTYA